MTSLLLALAVFASAAGRFEAAPVLIAHDLDPAKLALTATLTPAEAPAEIRVSGDYDGLPIPGVVASRYGPLLPGSDGWKIDADPLPQALRGRGLGTTLYLIAARLVRDSSGGTVFSYSGDDARSDSASAVWDGLIRSRVAERRGLIDHFVQDDAALRHATDPALALLRPRSAADRPKELDHPADDHGRRAGQREDPQAGTPGPHRAHHAAR